MQHPGRYFDGRRPYRGLGYLLWGLALAVYLIPRRFYLIGVGYAAASERRSPFAPLFWALLALLAAALFSLRVGWTAALPPLLWLAWLCLFLCFMEALLLRDALIERGGFPKRAFMPRGAYLACLLPAQPAATAALRGEPWLGLVSLCLLAIAGLSCSRDFDRLVRLNLDG